MASSASSKFGLALLFTVSIGILMMAPQFGTGKLEMICKIHVHLSSKDIFNIFKYEKLFA
jgi:hypothetical protein